MKPMYSVDGAPGKLTRLAHVLRAGMVLDRLGAWVLKTMRNPRCFKYRRVAKLPDLASEWRRRRMVMFHLTHGAQDLSQDEIEWICDVGALVFGRGLPAAMHWSADGLAGSGGFHHAFMFSKYETSVGVPLEGLRGLRFNCLQGAFHSRLFASRSS